MVTFETFPGGTAQDAVIQAFPAGGNANVTYYDDGWRVSAQSPTTLHQLADILTH